jgi:hypothetical protein
MFKTQTTYAHSQLCRLFTSVTHRQHSIFHGFFKFILIFAYKTDTFLSLKKIKIELQNVIPERMNTSP